MRRDALETFVREARLPPTRHGRGTGRVDSTDSVESTRLVVTVVACRRQPEKVHALGRPDDVASGRYEFLPEPLLVGAHRLVGTVYVCVCPRPAPVRNNMLNALSPDGCAKVTVVGGKEVQ